MATFARLDGTNTVVELFVHATLLPSATHIPSIAAQFIPCPDSVVLGTVKNGNAWTPPAAVVVPAPPLPLLTPMTVYMAFTPAERIAIKASSDQMVIEFWAMFELSVQLDKPTDPNLISVQNALAYLAQPKTANPPGAGILASQARIAQIIAGTPQ